MRPTRRNPARAIPSATSGSPSRASIRRWRLAGVRSAAPIVDAFLDEKMAEHGLDESKTALVGFSQGTMMALHVGLRRAKPLAGIVGFSGMLAGPDVLKDEIKSRPPVLLAHGDRTRCCRIS